MNRERCHRLFRSLSYALNYAVVPLFTECTSLLPPTIVAAAHSFSVVDLPGDALTVMRHTLPHCTDPRTPHCVPVTNCQK